MLILLGPPLAVAAEPAAVVESRQVRLAVSGDGRVVELADKQTGKNYTPPSRAELKRVGFDSGISIEDGVDGIDQIRRSADFLRRKVAQYWG